MKRKKSPKSTKKMQISFKRKGVEFTMEVEVSSDSAAKCKKCGAVIYWGLTRNKKWIPLRWTKEKGLFAHWEDCPYSEDFKKDKKKK